MVDVQVQIENMLDGDSPGKDHHCGANQPSGIEQKSAFRPQLQQAGESNQYKHERGIRSNKCAEQLSAQKPDPELPPDANQYPGNN
jgi:hypothetical protein